MSGKKPAHKTIVVRPTHVVHRQSTDLLAIADAQVSCAVRYIRENSNRSLRVTDLVPISGLSRRALQNAFLKNLGRTPLEEIHICRADRIARMLIETNMSIAKIADATGFEMDAHLARFFSRRSGMTPLAYRRKHRMS
jgi:LacI family transcriptional regulator